MYKNAQNKYSLIFNRGDIYEMIRRYLTTFDNMNHLIKSAFIEVVDPLFPPEIVPNQKSYFTKIK